MPRTVDARSNRAFLPLLATAAVLALGAPDAHSQNIFDMIFGGQVRREREFAPRPPPPPQPPQQAAPKISAPSYYTYKTDALVKVRVPEPGTVSANALAGPGLSAVSFAEAMKALGQIELLAEKDIADAIAAHYAAKPQFLWVSGYHVNGRAEQALRVLGDAASYGLESAEYAVTVPTASFSMDDMAARQKELAAFELTLSARLLRYVRDARRGRIDPNRLSGYHDFALNPVDLRAALDTLSGSQDATAFLVSFHPQNPEYQALRVELESLRAAAENDIIIDPKLVLKPGETSAELPKLLAAIERKADADFATKFALQLAMARNKENYSQDLVPLIKAAQEAQGLKGDGVIGPRTVAALAGVSKADRINRVVVALEQLRWHPSDLGARRVFINQPAYTASYFEDGQEKLSMRVVIGKASNQTSFFYDEIEQIDYNPYWGVPQSIIVNEMLPRLRNDPGYLDRAGYEVTDSKGKRVSSTEVNWNAYGAKVPYSVRQSPSEANALGELKILFPNKHAIYMHDTPQKALFQREARAFSHGCVRLHQPREMAAAVLGSTVDHIKAKLAQGHSMEKVPGKIPVYVAYFTAWPDAGGVVQYFPDVYGRDQRVNAAMEKTALARTPAA